MSSHLRTSVAVAAVAFLVAFVHPAPLHAEKPPVKRLGPNVSPHSRQLLDSTFGHGVGVYAAPGTGGFNIPSFPSGTAWPDAPLGSFQKIQGRARRPWRRIDRTPLFPIWAAVRWVIVTNNMGPLLSTVNLRVPGLRVPGPSPARAFGVPARWHVGGEGHVPEWTFCRIFGHPEAEASPGSGAEGPRRGDGARGAGHYF